MATISQSAAREIIQDFAEEIRKRRGTTAKPSKAVILFRRDDLDKVERKIWLVPIDLLRYRKENGRIASDVIDYEKTYGLLDETDVEAQGLLRKFLERKDPEKTSILSKNIVYSGQREPAVVTCDGFLINGNRRKMVMESLRDEYPNNHKYDYMKVVILPGENEEGGTSYTA